MASQLRVLAIFDFDMTLLDTSLLQRDRDTRNWSSVRRLASGLSFDPAIVESLRSLTMYGAKIAVASSAPRWYLEGFLARLEVKVDIVLGNGDAERSMVAGLSHRAKIKAGQLLLLKRKHPGWSLVFIGDDGDDAEGARTADVVFIHACWGGDCAGIAGSHDLSPGALCQAILAAARGTH